MIHHIDPNKLDSLQKFSRLFDRDRNFELRKIPTVVGGRRFHMMTSESQGVHPRDRDFAGSSSHRDRALAALGALGETVERRVFANLGPDLPKATYTELIERGFRCMDPDTFRMFSPEQSAFQLGEVINLDRESSVEWTWFQDNSNKRILLPSGLLNNYGNEFPTYFMASTSGNGCGRTADGAKLSGLLELLERDAVMFYWWTMNTPPQLRLNLNDPRTRRVVGPHAAYMEKITLFYLPTDLKLATVLAIFRGDPELGEPRFLIAAASRPDPLEAIERALNEISQVWVDYKGHEPFLSGTDFSFDFDQSVWTFRDHLFAYTNAPMEKAYQFLFARRPAKVDVADLPRVSAPNAGKLIEKIVADMRRQNLRLYHKDLSRPDTRAAGLFVFRMVSPDLAQVECLHRRRQLGIPRYYELGRKLALSRQPRRFSDLNPFPHPFP